MLNYLSMSLATQSRLRQLAATHDRLTRAGTRLKTQTQKGAHERLLGGLHLAWCRWVLNFEGRRPCA